MKHLRFLRSLPGGGKSYLAAQMVKNEPQAMVFTERVYFNPKTIQADYKDLQKQVSEAMQLGLSPLIMDCCNIETKQFIPIVRLAHYHYYDWSIIESMPPWRMEIPELLKRASMTCGPTDIAYMKKRLLETSVELLVSTLKLEPATDPEVSLRSAQIAMENGFFGQVDEHLFDYEDWRKCGGYIPVGGDELAKNLIVKLKPWRDSDFCLVI
jgi:hypothetical protein